MEMSSCQAEKLTVLTASSGGVMIAAQMAQYYHFGVLDELRIVLTSASAA